MVSTKTSKMVPRMRKGENTKVVRIPVIQDSLHSTIYIPQLRSGRYYLLNLNLAQQFEDGFRLRHKCKSVKRSTVGTLGAIISFHTA